MKQLKPLPTIKQKCKDGCHDGTRLDHESIDCLDCKGSGIQTKEIYALRDFEKCPRCLGSGFIHGQVTCDKCKSTGYIIPFKNYEIKKVSEIFDILQPYGYFEFKKEHNLKEEDELVIRKQ